MANGPLLAFCLLPFLCQTDLLERYVIDLCDCRAVRAIVLVSCTRLTLQPGDLQAGAGQAWQDDVKAYLAAQSSSEGGDKRTKLADSLLSASATDPDTATRW